MQSTRTTPRIKAWTAAIVAAALALGGALFASPASAAPGDVAGATLSWGFNSYDSSGSPFTNFTRVSTSGGVAALSGSSLGVSLSGGSGNVDHASGIGSIQFDGYVQYKYLHDTNPHSFQFDDFRLDVTSATRGSLSAVVSGPYINVADTGSRVVIANFDISSLSAVETTFSLTTAAPDYTGVTYGPSTNGSWPTTLLDAVIPDAQGFWYSTSASASQLSKKPLPITAIYTAEQSPPSVPSTPTLTVSKTTGLNPDGETITVSGAGYNPAQAIYVLMCSDVPLSTVTFTFALPCTAGSKAIYPSTDTNPARLKFSADGSFTTTMTVAKNIAHSTGSAIYTLANHTAPADRTQDAKQAIAFTPLLTATKTTGLNPTAETVTVTGYGYNPAQAIYLLICRDIPLSEVSFTFASACVAGSKAIYPSTDTDPARLKFAADGSFTTTFTVANSSALASGAALYTLANHTAMNDRTQDAKRALSFVTGTATTTTLSSSAASVLAGGSVTLTASVVPASTGSITFYNGTESLGTVAALAGSAQQTVNNLSVGTASFRAVFTPTQPWLVAGSEGAVNVTVTSPVAAAGSLTWGVKSDFRAYVSGPIAQGTVTGSGVTTSGGAFVFPQVANGLSEAGTGTASYSGSVRFYGHSGALDITLRNPVVTVNSTTSGTLTVTHGGSQIAIASLNLGAGIRSTPNSTVSYSAVPATLTAAGVPVFGNYAAGTALDPVSFVIGSNGSTSAGTTTAAFAGDKVPPQTSPATTGVTLSDGTELEEGGEVTITADGFEANETDIMIVIYSSPVVLARNVTADANGVVTWTGRLPAGLTGEHTLTVQGSVNRGVVLNIPATKAASVEGCPVDDATITWGFKESFRSYISGTIANGEWTVADGATYETPNFGWANGTGGYDTETAKGLLAFTGSIAFTGHSGVLNTVVANPQLEFVDEKTAYLLMDVSGTTQDGAAVEQKAVRFVELALADGEGTGSGDTITLTAVPTTLTDEGAEAFGTYEAGSEFDPITVSFSAGCAELATEAAPVDAEQAGSSPDLGWIWWVLAVLVLAAIVVVVIVLVTRRKVAA